LYTTAQKRKRHFSNFEKKHKKTENVKD